MRIFNDKNGWAAKVNFVDENNVFVGYDTHQSCCEHADWFISDSPQNEIQDRTNTQEEMDGWKFDREYFQEVEVENSSDLDEGGMVRFRLTKGEKEKFLHLFNCHNGFYGHGFTFGVGDTVEHNGCL